MSLTETTDNLINKIIATENGITEANLTIKSLSIKRQQDGSKTIYVQDKGHDTIFTLSQNECEHLATLLNS